MRGRFHSGTSVLLFFVGQVVTCVPSHRLPTKLSLMGAASKQNEIEENERQAEPEDETIDDLTPRGQILWIRGLTRLQHQVSANAPFRFLLSVCLFSINFLHIALPGPRRMHFKVVFLQC